jgi:CheY-like chemotaxis protein
MRLKFNILCFEDNPKNLKPVLKGVENHLEESGFELKIVGPYQNNEGLDKIIEDIKARRLDVDLILMDYLLTRDQKGSTLIKSIRDCELYTDIIFYTQKGDLEKKIGFLEGIYLAGRDTLREKTIMVIDNLLKKALDLSNLRGLVMAETSELDDLMEDIILTFINGNLLKNPAMELVTIKKKLIEDSTTKLENLKKIDEHNQANGQYLISESLTSFHKARAVTRLTNIFMKAIEAGKTNDEKLKDIAQKLSGIDFNAKQYKEEILSLRNILAHVRECKNENGEKILCSTPPRKDFVFNESQSLEARKNLKKYFKILSGIYETISGGKWD